MSWATIATALSHRPDMLTTTQMSGVMYRNGMTKWAAMRAALGQAEAVVAGRVVPRTREEWVMVMVAAIDDGLEPPGRGWRARWAELRTRHPRYVVCTALERGARRHGGLGDLYAAGVAAVAARTDTPRMGAESS
jgi:hypothetical protein